MLIVWSTAALFMGYIMDALWGDPYSFPHIVRWMGGLIAALEKRLRRLFLATQRGEKTAGIFLLGIVILICGGLPLSLLFLSYRFFLPLGFALESLLCWQLLAAKSLKTESMKVYDSLEKNDLPGARTNASMIVGRDVSVLDEEGIIRAAVETVAENTSDGVTAPLFYIALGGGALGCIYKAVNTMDSMVGYKNDKYLYFGRAAAKLDDVLNYIPSRLCALLMIVSARLLRFDSKGAYRIWRRDRRKHASPNSAQTEAVCAGALGIRLAGPAVYFGKLYEKPTIGDDIRPVQTRDIADANRLMSMASWLTLLVALLFRALCWGVWYGSI